MMAADQRYLSNWETLSESGGGSGALTSELESVAVASVLLD